MRRGISVSWHALSFLLAAVLYFIFVLPRWWELMGDVSHGVGTTLRIVTGVLIGLTALPVTLNLLRVRKPEFGTPKLAMTLRVWSIVAHVLAGVLIVGTAVAEIWASLDSAGQWLFGVYGAAAAIAVLGACAFYLSFVAELPPAPPKPLKPKKSAVATTGGDAGTDADDEAAEESVLASPEDASTDDAAPSADAPDDAAPEKDASEVSAEVEDSQDEQAPAEPDTAEPEPAPTGGRLRNRRPSGKSRIRRSGGVAVSED